MLSYCRRSCNHCSSSSEPGDVTGGNDGMYEWKIYDKMKRKTALYREQFQHLITETETKSIPQHIDTIRPLIHYPFVHFLFDHCNGCPSLIHVLCLPLWYLQDCLTCLSWYMYLNKKLRS